MANDRMIDAPGICPITGEKLYISELTSAETGIVIRGKFELPKFAQLDPEQQRILEVFIRSRGVISTMERELGLSYPTVRSRIDGLLAALNFEPIRPTAAPEREDRVTEEKRKILAELESGSISASEAKTRLKEVATR